MRLIQLVILVASAYGILWTQPRNLSIDHQFAPNRSFALICFPDDWQKTVVTDQGVLGYDFGPGPYAVPLTTVALGQESLSVKRQTYRDPRIPVTTTELASPGRSATLTSFALLPEMLRKTAGSFHRGRVRRLGGLEGMVAWSSPPDSIDPALHSVAWGVNRPVRYEVAVTPGARKNVALAVCESYKTRAGLRILEFSVEGALPLTVNPMADGVRNRPVARLLMGQDVNRDGWLSIECRAALQSPDPNVILNAFWVFADSVAPPIASILNGSARREAELIYDCGPEDELDARPPRMDALVGTFTPAGGSSVVTISSPRSFSLERTTGFVMSNGRPFLRARPRPLRLSRTGRSWSLEFPPGASTIEVVVFRGDARDESRREFPDLEKERRKVEQYWTDPRTLPSNRILIPDQGLQAVLDASSRTMYQVREVVDGLTQFQPGPGLYRGLWAHGAMLQIDAALMLGDSAGARYTLEALLRQQNERGQIVVMAPYPMNRETPLFVYAACRYYLLTGDSTWILRHWQHVRSGLNWIRRERERTLAESTGPGSGLMPPGFADGGLGGIQPEYSSTYWSLIALREAVTTLTRLGMRDERREWDSTFREFYRSFRTAASRDMRRTREGWLYLPMLVADTSRSRPPQQAQWALCEAVYRGRFLDADDSLVTGSLSMLQASEEEGLAVGAGWLQGGVWPIFSAIQAMAHLWTSENDKAVALLYAVANHASPLGTWFEEQLPKRLGGRAAGDGSMASASGVFISLVRRLIAMERNTGIDLLAGVPQEWYSPGATIALNGVPTEFGELRFSVKISDDGHACTIDVAPMRGDGTAGGPTLHLSTLRRLGFRSTESDQELVQGSWGKKLVLHLQR